MPKKPIKPDRVRIPTQLLWTQIAMYCVGASLVVFFELTKWMLPDSAGLGITVFVSLTAYAAIYCGPVWYATRLYNQWIKRIVEHDGFMCPQCAYPLTGIQTERTSVTCPECGYFTRDTYQLFERWRKTMKSLCLQDDKRLRNRKYKGPDS